MARTSVAWRRAGSLAGDSTRWCWSPCRSSASASCDAGCGSSGSCSPTPQSAGWSDSGKVARGRNITERRRGADPARDRAGHGVGGEDADAGEIEGHIPHGQHEQRVAVERGVRRGERAAEADHRQRGHLRRLDLRETRIGRHDADGSVTRPLEAAGAGRDGARRVDEAAAVRRFPGSRDHGPRLGITHVADGVDRHQRGDDDIAGLGGGVADAPAHRARDAVDLADRGAGAGATVGKVNGVACAMRGGVGYTAAQAGDIVVTALMAVNAVGDVRDPETGAVIAGTREAPDSRRLIDSARAIAAGAGRFEGPRHTTIGVVTTNARLTKIEAAKVASLAMVGFGRALSPPHTAFDGDSLFVLSVGDVPFDLTRVGVLAADAVARAIARGVRAATSLRDIPAARDLAAI